MEMNGIVRYLIWYIPNAEVGACRAHKAPIREYAMDTKIITVSTVFLLITLLYCTTTAEDEPDIRTQLSRPYRKVDPSFDPRTGLAERITDIPQILLENMKELDPYYDGSAEYDNHRITSAQRRRFSAYIDMLPEAYKRVMRDRLTGIYFVRNFQSGGLVDIQVDSQNRIYCFMIMNPASFDFTVSEWLRLIDLSSIDRNGDYDVRYEVTDVYPAVFYLLLHEAGHVYDYIHHATPYIDDFHRRYRERYEPDALTRQTPYTQRYWTDIRTPAEKYDYTNRERMNFFGTGEEKREKLPNGEMPATYRSFSRTPFVSLYAGSYWSEDFAEASVFYHLTERMGMPYRITVLKNGREVFTYEPMKSPLVRQRMGLVARHLY